MQASRSQLLALLRAHKDEKAAQRVEQSLPKDIDLARDAALLQQCGVDPNVLAAILMAQGSAWTFDFGLRPHAQRAGHRPSIEEPASPAPRTPGRRCPRCHQSFRTARLMVDHQAAMHRAERTTEPGNVLSRNCRRRIELTTAQIENALAELECDLENVPERRRRHLALMTTVAVTLMILGVVTVLAGAPLPGVLAILVAAAAMTLRYRLRTSRRPGGATEQSLQRPG